MAKDERAEMAAGEAAAQAMWADDGEAAQAAERLAERLQIAAGTRQSFLRYGASYLETGAFENEHRDSGRWWQFLARVGMSASSEPYHNEHHQRDLTDRVARAIADLHEPGTLVSLKTTDRHNVHAGMRYAVGHVVETHPRIVNAALVLDVQTATVNGEPLHSELGIGGIADYLDRYKTPAPRSETFRIGAGAVRDQVERAYEGEVRATTDEESVLMALVVGGVKLADLRSDPAVIKSRRASDLAGLTSGFDTDRRYAHEILTLVPLYDTNAEALAAVDSIVGSDLRDLSYFGRRDYDLLRQSQVSTGQDSA